MFLSCVSDLWCKVIGIGAQPLGEKTLSIPPLELFTCECALCVPVHPLFGLTKYTVVGTTLCPSLTVGMPSIDPGDSQALFSPGYWHRSSEVKSQDCSSCAPGFTEEL